MGSRTKAAEKKPRVLGVVLKEVIVHLGRISTNTVHAHDTQK